LQDAVDVWHALLLHALAADDVSDPATLLEARAADELLQVGAFKAWETLKARQRRITACRRRADTRIKLA
jgi:hypothetical protein